jgi:hypothetical protein
MEEVGLIFSEKKGKDHWQQMNVIKFGGILVVRQRGGYAGSPVVCSSGRSS